MPYYRLGTSNVAWWSIRIKYRNYFKNIEVVVEYGHRVSRSAQLAYVTGQFL